MLRVVKNRPKPFQNSTPLENAKKIIKAFSRGDFSNIQSFACLYCIFNDAKNTKYLKNINKQLKKLRLNCERGSDDPNARVILAILEYFGWGLDKNEHNALFILKGEELVDNPNRLWFLGIISANKGNYKKAHELLETAATNGSVIALTELGILEYYGKNNSKKKDYKAAYEYLKKAAAKKNAKAFYYLGLLYYSGHGVKKNHKTFLKYIRKSAQAGYSQAMYRLGAEYYKGKVVRKNQDKAYEYFEEAASLGHQESSYQLAIIIEGGEAVNQSLKDVTKYLTAAMSLTKVSVVFKLDYHLGRKAEEYIAAYSRKLTKDKVLTNDEYIERIKSLHQDFINALETQSTLQDDDSKTYIVPISEHHTKLRKSNSIGSKDNETEKKAIETYEGKTSKGYIVDIESNELNLSLFFISSISEESEEKSNSQDHASSEYNKVTPRSGGLTK